MRVKELHVPCRRPTSLFRYQERKPNQRFPDPYLRVSVDAGEEAGGELSNLDNLRTTKLPSHHVSGFHVAVLSFYIACSAVLSEVTKKEVPSLVSCAGYRVIGLPT